MLVVAQDPREEIVTILNVVLPHPLCAIETSIVEGGMARWTIIGIVTVGAAQIVVLSLVVASAIVAPRPLVPCFSLEKATPQMPSQSSAL